MLPGLSCVRAPTRLYRNQQFKKTLGATRRRKVGRSHMAQFLDKHLLARANTALLLTLVWGGLAACAIAAAVYDVSHWIKHW